MILAPLKLAMVAPGNQRRTLVILAIMDAPRRNFEVWL
jgi:hypothetical protein